MKKPTTRSKRLLVLADMHCGHVVGLTPPAWRFKTVQDDITKRNKYALLQKESWDWYIRQRNEICAVKKPDYTLINGDCIDGRAKASGGTELITIDREQQCEMAIQAIKVWNCKNIVMTYGTPYHTGKLEDWENIIARELYAKKIGAHEWIDINNVIIDAKHKVGGSGIPHGRFTAIARANLWSKLWSEEDLTPKSNIIIRSHAHFYSEARDRNSISIITPALQGMGSKYGAKECEGLVDFGLIVIDINISGKIENIDVRLAKLHSQKVIPLKF